MIPANVHPQPPNNTLHPNAAQKIRKRTTKETNSQPHHHGSTQPLSTTSPAPTNPHTHRAGDSPKRMRQPAHPLTPDRGQNTSKRPKEPAPAAAQPPWPK